MTDYKPKVPTTPVQFQLICYFLNHWFIIKKKKKSNSGTARQKKFVGQETGKSATVCLLFQRDTPPVISMCSPTQKFYEPVKISMAASFQKHQTHGPLIDSTFRG